MSESRLYRAEAGIFTPCEDHRDFKRILIVAGEASGDLHGSNLVRAMKRLNSEIAFYGAFASAISEGDSLDNWATRPEAAIAVVSRRQR